MTDAYRDFFKMLERRGVGPAVLAQLKKAALRWAAHKR